MRKPPTPTIVTMAVFTTVTVVLWIFISVYNILIKKADVDVPEKLLTPIETGLDVEMLKEISERTYITEGEEKPFNVEPQFIPPQPEASDSASQ